MKMQLKLIKQQFEQGQHPSLEGKILTMPEIEYLGLSIVDAPHRLYEYERNGKHYIMRQISGKGFEVMMEYGGK